jgi:hypothetical protein
VGRRRQDHRTRGWLRVFWQGLKSWQRSPQSSRLGILPSNDDWCARDCWRCSKLSTRSGVGYGAGAAEGRSCGPGFCEGPCFDPADFGHSQRRRLSAESQKWRAWSWRRFPHKTLQCRPAGVDVNRSFPIAAADVAVGREAVVRSRVRQVGLRRSAHSTVARWPGSRRTQRFQASASAFHA